MLNALLCISFPILCENCKKKQILNYIIMLFFQRNEIAEMSDVFQSDLELGAVGGEYRADGAASVFLHEHSERSSSTSDRSSGRSFYSLSTDSGRESLFSHTAGNAWLCLFYHFNFCFDLIQFLLSV